jgi:hypothetical protein
LIHRKLEHQQSNRYLEYLEGVVNTYNARGHRSLKFMSPDQAELEENRDAVLNAHRERVSKILRKQPRLQLGDIVHIRRARGPFNKGYHRRWQTERFEIIYINLRMPIPMFTIKSLNNEKIQKRKFYAEELQPISKENVYRIVVLRKKKVGGRLKLYVDYVGFDRRHRAWIDAENDVVQDFREPRSNDSQ